MSESSPETNSNVLNSKYLHWPERWPGPGTYIWWSGKNHHFLIISPIRSIIRNLGTYVRMSDSENGDSLDVGADSMAWPEQWPEPGIYEWTSDKNYYYLVVTPIEAITTFEKGSVALAMRVDPEAAYVTVDALGEIIPVERGGGYSSSSYDYYDPNAPDVCWDPCAGIGENRDPADRVDKMKVHKKNGPLWPGGL
ncbi:Hypothetical protein Tpal_238 [Trichococcus palustris]|uniref:Uncharacterized protein n=1 Tax=Trichococcus palustris TaxID=140314 RepID=A0A143Y4W9_9LACT|nr:hypothetical protein [Trichococcus palustris]CZQ81759.1 Hypothetical protein Tpal_238 [Trichococcus palustris]SFK61830.1 hypothetical protein SAMN04488076_10252 [Trichococcus palustris]